MAVLTHTEVLDDLGVTSPTSAESQRMIRSIAAAQRNVERYLGYPVERANHVEFYPVNRQRNTRDEFVEVIGQRVRFGRETDGVLILQCRPVVNNANLKVYEQYNGQSGQSSGAFPVSSLLTKGTDYFLDVMNTGNYSMSGILYRRSGVWNSDPGSIKVEYDAGFSADDFVGSGDLPNACDIYDALMDEAKREYRQRTINANAAALGAPLPLASESIGNYSYSTGGGNVAEVGNSMILSHLNELRLASWRKMGGRLA